LARAFSRRVPSAAAWLTSSVLAKDCPAKASRRNNRHQGSIKFSQAALTGMNNGWMRGRSANHAWMGRLLWLLSVVADQG
jgi:hypothetical protein